MATDKSMTISVRVPREWHRALVMVGNHKWSQAHDPDEPRTASGIVQRAIWDWLPPEVREHLPNIRPSRRPTNEELAESNPPTAEELEAIIARWIDQD